MYRISQHIKTAFIVHRCLAPENLIKLHLKAGQVSFENKSLVHNCSIVLSFVCCTFYILQQANIFLIAIKTVCTRVRRTKYMLTFTLIILQTCTKKKRSRNSRSLNRPQMNIHIPEI